MQLLPKWNIDLRPVWQYLQDEVVILAILFRTPFYLAAAIGATSSSFAWVLVLTQFAVNILAKYRATLQTARLTLDPVELKKKQMRNTQKSLDIVTGHVHKTRRPSYVRVPGMADPKGESGDSLANDASVIATLRVTVLYAQDLIVKSRGSKDPNPYCKLFLIAGGEKSKHEYVTSKCRGTKMPKWSEDKELKAFEKINIQESHLRIQLWDHHTIWKDKLIGEVEIPVSKIQHGHNEAQYDLKQSAAESAASTISLGVVTLRTHLFLLDEDLAQIQAQSEKLPQGLAGRVSSRDAEQSVFSPAPDNAEETGDQGGAAPDPAEEAEPGSPRLFAAKLQRMALKITALYLHAIGGLTAAFLFGLYGVDVFLLAVLVEVLIVLERRLPALTEAIEEDDEEHGHPHYHPAASVTSPRIDTNAPYQPFLAELFSKMRGDAAKGRIDVSAEWLTGALAMAWELYTPWADKFVGRLIRDPLTPLGLELEYFTVGQLPLACKSIKGFPHKRPGNYYDLVLQLEWAADVYIQIGWKGIPLLVVEGLYLSAGIKAAMKMLELTASDAPTMFPNLEGLRVGLAQRPELDVQVKLFGVVDIFSFMLLAYVKEVALDYVFENVRNFFYFANEQQRQEALQWIEDFRAGNTLLGPWGERFADPPRPMVASVFKGQRFRLVVTCVLGRELAERDKVSCVLRFGRGTAKTFGKDKKGDAVKHDMVVKQTSAASPESGETMVVWQEQFCWLTRDEQNLLEVEVFSHSTSFGVWKEEFGIMRRAMNLTPDAPPTLKPIDMGPGKGKVDLMVQLQTLWDDPPPAPNDTDPALPLGSPTKKAKAPPEIILRQSPWKSQSGLLIVNLIKADSLPPNPEGTRKAVTVKFYLVKQEQMGSVGSLFESAEWLVKQSPPAYNNLSPRWSNQTIENVFHLEVEQAVSSTMLVAQLCDGNEFLGYSALQLGDLVGGPASRVFTCRDDAVKQQLLNGQDQPVAGDRLSTLHMDLEFTPEPLEAVDAKTVRNLHGDLTAPFPGPYLKVEIVRCYNLTNLDLMGKSDPFAEVSVYDVPDTGDVYADAVGSLRSCACKRTYTVNNDLNPEWREQVYYFFLDRNHDQEIKVVVKDEESLGQSELIGQWSDSVRKLYFVPGASDRMLKQLENELGAPAGTLEISVRFLGDWTHLSAPPSMPSPAPTGFRQQ